MSRDIISNFEKFSEKASGLKFEDSIHRVDCLKQYFAKGGVVSVSFNSLTKSKWPKLLYPTPLRLKEQLKESEGLRKEFFGKHSDWKKKHFDASVYHLSHNVKKFKEPLFWKHLAKYATDKDYREDAKKIKLPAHLVSDPKWKPMVKMFVSDLDYRKQLTQTVDQSIVYKSDKRVAKYADDLKDFRMEQASKQIKDLAKRLQELDLEIQSLKEMLKWANE